VRAVGPLCVALAVALAGGPAAADPGDPDDPLDPAASISGENLRVYADHRARGGDFARAAEYYFLAYDRLTGDPAVRLAIGGTHESLEKGVNAAAEAQRRDPARVDLLCSGDLRLVRHAVFLADAGYLTPEAIAVLRSARGRLHGRLVAAGTVCPRPDVDGPPSIRVFAADMRGDLDGPLVDEGALVRATAAAMPPPDRAPARDLRLDRARAMTRAGTLLMAGGLLTIGLGVALSTQDRDASAALTLVVGTTAFTAGVPLLILGDKHRRHRGTLAVRPGGLAVSF
jgi:hypothetical protein